MVETSKDLFDTTHLVHEFKALNFEQVADIDPDEETSRLMEHAKALKQRFVDDIMHGDTQVGEQWAAVKVWLLESELEFMSAIELMLQPAAEENKPFEEKYQAREKLNKLLDAIKPEWEESQVIKCFKALLLHRLGTNYYDSEELSMGEKKMQESAAVWRTVSAGIRLNFSNCIQDVNNVIAIVRAQREDSKEALVFLEQAL